MIFFVFMFMLRLWILGSSPFFSSSSWPYLDADDDAVLSHQMMNAIANDNDDVYCEQPSTETHQVPCNNDLARSIIDPIQSPQLTTLIPLSLPHLNHSTPSIPLPLSTPLLCSS